MLLTDFCERRDCVVNLLESVCGAQLSPDARETFWNHGVAESYNVDTFIKQIVRHIGCESRVTEHDWGNWTSVVAANLEPSSFDTLSESCQVGLEFVLKFVRFLQHLEHFEGCANYWWSNRI